MQFGNQIEAKTWSKRGTSGDFYTLVIRGDKYGKSYSQIESIIGHLKSEYRLTRNRFKGVLGDSINEILI